MFGSGKSNGPIERRHERHLRPLPSVDALTSEAISRAGMDHLKNNPQAYANLYGQTQSAILQTVENQGVEGLSQLVSRRSAAGMRTLKERYDFRPEMLFNYLTMHGPKGIAIHNNIVDYITDPQFMINLSEVISENYM